METLAYLHACEAFEATTGIAPAEFVWFGNSKTMPKSGGLRLLSAVLLACLFSLSGMVYMAAARNLSWGMSGDDVAELQTLLIDRGHTIDYGATGAGKGKFGPRTQRALLDFQQASGLVVDGIAGPQTMTALRGGDPAVGRELSQGMSGADVAELQRRLKERGYFVDSLNERRGAYFGPRTETAVLLYQRDTAGVEATGIAKADTIKALRDNQGGRRGNARVVTEGGGLSVRSRPDSNAQSIDRLERDTRVEILLEQGDWYRIQQGWVSARYINKEG